MGYWFKLLVPLSLSLVQLVLDHAMAWAWITPSLTKTRPWSPLRWSLPGRARDPCSSLRSLRKGPWSTGRGRDIGLWPEQARGAPL